MKMEYVRQPSHSPTSPSFPHAFSGNPGEIRTGPPIKTFGGDGLGSRISAPQPLFSKEITKATKNPHNKPLNLRALRVLRVKNVLSLCLRLHRGGSISVFGLQLFEFLVAQPGVPLAGVFNARGL